MSEPPERFDRTGYTVLLFGRIRLYEGSGRYGYGSFW